MTTGGIYLQTKWMQLLLNGGVDPTSNATIIPRSAFEAVTTASAIMFGTGIPAERSLMGYGMGWMRTSYRGQEACSPTFIQLYSNPTMQL